MIESAERVVLLADDGSPIGVAPKATIHTRETPLHLAFSCHVFDARGRILVTRRSLNKLTWPGVWTNSFCGHPGPAETIENAIARRADSELGISLTGVALALPHFRYRAVDASGVVENEICPVYMARTSDSIRPQPDEVAEWQWAEAGALLNAVTAAPWAFSPWLSLQLPGVLQARD
ncbi:MAG: isopentenyl-diphosphate Delta-isomerase [Chloroflexota bacterium]